MIQVSIITPTFNSSKTILRTLESINRQTYRDFEHLIIDGVSNDKTLNLIKNYEGYAAVIYSEKDNGIYDAMNKGVEKSSGNIISILNSDDYYHDENVLKEIVDLFEKGADIVYGGIAYCNTMGDITFKWIPTEFNVGAYSKGWHTPHPAFFVSRKLYQRKGLFDLDYKIAADFDLMLRFMEDPSLNIVRLPRILVIMQDDGASSKIKNIIRGGYDILRSFKKNNIKINILKYICIRYFPKIINKFFLKIR